MQAAPMAFSPRRCPNFGGERDSQYERLAAEVAELTSEQWREDIEAYGRKMRRGVLLASLTEHEIHHRGQLYTYYHLAGITPPPLY